MHPSAMNNGRCFFERYLSYLPNGTPARIIEIGAQNVNGSLRDACPTTVEYIGVDFVAGKGVDCVLTDPYSLPFEDCSADMVVSSSCFEHSELFWLLFLEVVRILRPHGLFYLNAPSNGSFHRYPVDCWRFYPDSGRALVRWAERNRYNTELLESFTSHQLHDQWNDYVAVFIKDKAHIPQYPERMLTGRDDIENITVHGREDIIKRCDAPQDLRLLQARQQQLNNIKNILETE